MHEYAGKVLTTTCAVMQTLQVRVCTTSRFLKLDPTCSTGSSEASLLLIPAYYCTLLLSQSGLHLYLKSVN